jgi:hypothetical protein
MHVDAESRIQPIFDNAGDYQYWGSATPAYTAHSLLGRPSPEELREADQGFVPAREYYLRLPNLPGEIRSLADSLLGGLASNYDKAAALERWFQEEFAYTLELPGSAQEATLEHFLLRRREGHCEYFSTAMAILLRTQGIPTREVNGFLGGEWSEFGNYLAVTQNQAHAWVEVWPGRFLFDAIQHRWNKWILDYSFQTQFSLFRRGQELLRRASDPGQSPQEEGGSGLPGGAFWWALGAAFLTGAGLLTWRGGTSVPLETRLFLRLREAGRRAGVPTEALYSPLSLTRHLKAVEHPGASSARAVVDGYLQARFSGEELEGARQEAMGQALRRARESLRTAPLR